MAAPILVTFLNLDISMEKAWGDLQCTHIFPVAVIALSLIGFCSFNERVSLHN